MLSPARAAAHRRMTLTQVAAVALCCRRSKA